MEPSNTFKEEKTEPQDPTVYMDPIITEYLDQENPRSLLLYHIILNSYIHRVKYRSCFLDQQQHYAQQYIVHIRRLGVNSDRAVDRNCIIAYNEFILPDFFRLDTF